MDRLAVIEESAKAQRMHKEAFVGISIPIKEWDKPGRTVVPDVSIGFPNLLSVGIKSKKIGLNVGKSSVLRPRLAIGMAGPSVGISIGERSQARTVRKAKDKGIGKTAMRAGFFDEFEKLAWRGTYYHGATPAAEKSILSTGLKASMGGKGAGAVAGIETGFKHLGVETADNPLLQKIKGHTKGKATMSRSKLLSKVYGGVRNPEMHREVEKAVRDRKPFQAVKRAIRGVAEHQPLQIAGKGLKGLTRDPNHPLVGVMRGSDIPSKLISRAKPSRIGNVVRKLLRK